MQIVVTLSEEDYYVLITANDDKLPSITARRHLFAQLKEGTLLPKGHGVLKDVDKIVMESSVDMWTDNGYESMIAVEAINNSPTIIEADKEVSK